MENLETLLQEIYTIDPSLKSREEEIKKIILALADSRPDVVIDATFVARLRSELVYQPTYNTMENELTPQFTPTPNGGETPKTPKPTPVVVWGFNFRLIGGLVVAAIILAIAIPYAVFNLAPGTTPDLGGMPIATNDDGSVVVETPEGDIKTVQPDTGTIITGFVKFKSEEDYKKYLAQADEAGAGFGGGIAVQERALSTPTATSPLSAPSVTTDAIAPSRVSQTNVQVRGIDEPDILKTNGTEIYFAPDKRYYYGGGDGIRPLPAIEPTFIDEPAIGVPSIIAPPSDFPQPQTHVINAFPVDELAKESAIDNAGDLLLHNDTLVILENREIYGYDISDPQKPAQKWNVSLDSRNSIVQSRLYDEKIYLITQTGANRSRPCPIPLFTAGGREIIVPCTNIYHPTVPVPTNVNYHIATIDPADGALTEGISFTGSYNSTIYMSPEDIYAAYGYQGDTVKLVLGLFKENTDIVPQTVTDRIVKLEGYDISNQSKLNELNLIVQDFLNSLDEDESLRVENELQNRADDYFKRHKRELSKTDIVKISVADLKVKAMGTIPGDLLNQFSLDEYQGNLRVATTVGGGFFFRFGGSREQENDVYVLDENLSVIGSIKGLGLDERIFSARFIQDKGYLVTFRQIDPFFVLDLSNPKNPQVKGELKIPGYSSYLHPVTKDKIVGIGKEGSNVKISLFDVANPSNPTEADKYMLDEFWSDVLNTHHAFLLDDKHNVFFMPGSRGGYVFSYEGNTLSLKKAVSGINAIRALFIDDYLYIVARDQIVVLDENTWERVNELKIK